MRIEYPAYKLTGSDLERLEIVTQRVLGSFMSASVARDLVGRSAGFSDAGELLAALEKGPVLLLADISREQAFCKAEGIDWKALPRAADCPACPMAAIVAAGLAWAEQESAPSEAERPAREKLARTAADGGTTERYFDLLKWIGPANYSRGAYVYCSSLIPEDLEDMGSLWSDRILLDRELMIVLTPDDMRPFMVSNHAKLRYLAQPAPWMAQKIRVKDTGRIAFDLEEAWPIDWSSQDELQEKLGEIEIACFAPSDEAMIASLLQLAGVARPETSLCSVKDTMLYIDDEPEGDLFTIGHAGMALLDLPGNVEAFSPLELSRFGVGWLSEIVEIAWDFEREAAALFASQRAEGSQGFLTYVSRPASVYP